jgi:hypothetical protein
MTREDDVFVPLGTRVRLGIPIETRPLSPFISIVQPALGANGIEPYYYSRD